MAAALLSACRLASAFAETPQVPSRDRPNIIVILADDLGYADTSVNPGARFQTPNIERIAREGVRFTDGYASAAVCAPSRAGLLTGRYQERFGFQYNDGGSERALRQGLGLPLDQATLARQMQRPVGQAQVAQHDDQEARHAGPEHPRPEVGEGIVGEQAQQGGE